MHCNLPARTPRPRPDRCHASAGWLPALLCCLLLVRPTYYDSTCMYAALACIARCYMYSRPAELFPTHSSQTVHCAVCCEHARFPTPCGWLLLLPLCACACDAAAAAEIGTSEPRPAAAMRARGGMRCDARSRRCFGGQRAAAAAAAAAGRGRQGAATLARARGELTPTPHSRECRHRRVKSGHASGHTHGPARHRAQGAGRRWPLAGSGRLPRAGLSSGFANCFFAQLLSY